MNKIFLTAAWQKLIMANFAIDAGILKPYLPGQTELDFRDGICYVSLVGFMFLNTKLKGMRIPFHSDFEEVNLRFYVRFKDNGEWKRGTVFIKEIVPKPAIAFFANLIYGEKYETRPMRHTWAADQQQQQQTIHYAWKKNTWNSIKVTAGQQPMNIQEGSEEAFIAEHYWGLSKGKGSSTPLYKVEHPTWQVYETIAFSIDVDFNGNYGKQFEFLTHETPVSVFLAEGSDILIRDKQVLR